VRQLFDFLNQLFDPRKRPAQPQQFSLQQPPPPGGKPDVTVSTELPTADLTPTREVQMRAAAAERHIDQLLNPLQGDLTDDVEITVERLRAALHHRETSGLVIRKLVLPASPGRRVYAVFVDGLVDSQSVELAIIEPLMTQTRLQGSLRTGLELLRQVDETLMPGRQVEHVHSLGLVISGIVSGMCALLVETAPGILLVEVRKWPMRAVERPLNEGVLRGPQEGFTEVLKINTTLIRRRLMTPDLIFEPGKIGRRSRTDIAVVYLKGLVSPALLEEVRRRIAHVDTDLLLETGQLEQLIEDSPQGLFPTLQATERPDRTAAALAEGRVAILMEGSPLALIVPAVLTDFLRIPEDYYVKWPFGTFLRIVRTLGLVITLLLPALYIAIADYHHEMIPPALLTAIAASREQVPFPATLEVLMMEVAFEVIREGAIRVPSQLGQTIGIVGALILGQAAVEASIISPILIIIVATTALGSFTIPDYSLNLVIRVSRFVMIFLGATLGLYGVAIGLFAFSVHAVSLKSFGVPYLAPMGPPQPGNPDNMLRGPTFLLDKRPTLARPRDKQRQAEKVMGWRVPPSNNEEET